MNKKTVHIVALIEQRRRVKKTASNGIIAETVRESFAQKVVLDF